MRLMLGAIAFLVALSGTMAAAGQTTLPAEQAACRQLLTAWQSATAWTSNCSFQSVERSKLRWVLPASKAGHVDADAVFICGDGRFNIISRRWGRVDPARFPQPEPPEKAFIMQMVYRPSLPEAQFVILYRDPGNKPPRVGLESSTDANATRHVSGGMLDGYILSPDQPTPSYLLQHLSWVSHRPVQRGESMLQELDASTPYGQVAVILDPEHGMNVAEITLNKRAGDLLRADDTVKLPFVVHQQRGPDHREMADKTVVDSVSFQQIGETWVTSACRFREQTTYDDGSHEGESQYARNQIDLHPDFQKMNAFAIDVPNGTSVFTGNAGGKHHWQDGRIVPDEQKNSEGNK